MLKNVKQRNIAFKRRFNLQLLLSLAGFTKFAVMTTTNVVNTTNSIHFANKLHLRPDKTFQKRKSPVTPREFSGSLTEGETGTGSGLLAMLFFSLCSAP